LLESSKYEIREVPINDYSLHMNLKILNVQRHDFGGYVCASVNALGKVEGGIRLQGKWRYCIRAPLLITSQSTNTKQVSQRSVRCAQWQPPHRPPAHSEATV
jgi:hypothetical protein